MVLNQVVAIDINTLSLHNQIKVLAMREKTGNRPVYYCPANEMNGIPSILAITWRRLGSLNYGMVEDRLIKKGFRLVVGQRGKP